MKSIIKNAMNSWLTTIAGAVAGIPEIQAGVQTGDSEKIILGVGLFLVGLFAKDSNRTGVN